MIKVYCITCGKYRKFEKPKLSYLLEKTLIENWKYSILIENIKLKIYNSFKNIAEVNINQ